MSKSNQFQKIKKKTESTRLKQAFYWKWYQSISWRYNMGRFAKSYC